MTVACKESGWVSERRRHRTRRCERQASLILYKHEGAVGAGV